MNLIISNAANEPIYEQIYRQVKSAIIAGELAEGEQLPSIRQLAKDLRISVITTKRAYDELERDGYLDSVAGKGSFVAPKNTQLLQEAVLRDIEGHLQAALQLAPGCGLTPEDLAALVRTLAQEDEE